MKYCDLYNKVVELSIENKVDLTSNSCIEDFCNEFSKIMRDNFAKYYEIGFIDGKLLLSAGGLYDFEMGYDEIKPFSESKYQKLFKYASGVDISIEELDDPDGNPFNITFILEI